MQPVKHESLEALFAKAVTLGEELLSLLAGAAPAGAIDRVTELLAERGRIGELTGALVAAGEHTPDALPLLRRIMQQQPAIEAAFASALEGVQSQHTVAQSQRHKLQGAHSLLGTGSQSRILNEYR